MSTDPPPPTDRRLSRRSALAAAGTAAAGLASTAGCTELLPPLGQTTLFTDVDVPDPAPPRYREWVPAPDASQEFGPTGDVLAPLLVAIPNNDSKQVLGASVDTGTAFIVPQVDHFGVGVENYDFAVHLTAGRTDVVVLEGPVAPSEVEDAVLASGYESDRSAEGYDRYVREDIPRTVAVTDGRILFGHGPGRDEAIQIALDAKAERVPQRAAEDAAFRRTTDAAGLRPFAMLGTHASGPLREYTTEWYASCLDYDESHVYYCNYYALEDDAPSVGDIEDAIEAQEIGDDVAAVDVDRDGSFVTVEMRFTDEIVSTDFSNTGPIPPQVTWGVDRTDDAFVVRHEAGDPIPAERLTLQEAWEEVVALDVQFTDTYATVGPGDSIAVPQDAIGQGDLVVQWAQGDSIAPLLEYHP